MQTANVDGVADIARFFKLTDENGWCAGNEAASVGFVLISLYLCCANLLDFMNSTIIDVWREMVSSLSIDEQREHRRPSSSLSASSDPTPDAEPEPYVYDSDDDRDPNDIVAQPQKDQADKTDMYGFDESDPDSDSD
jgi:hypothetical protein